MPIKERETRRFVLETRPLSEFEHLSPEEIKEHKDFTPKAEYPASNLVQEVFWEIADPDDIWYGKPHTPSQFADGEHAFLRGYRQWEYVGTLLKDESATVRMIVEQCDNETGRYDQKDKRSVLLFIYPVSIIKIMHEGWPVVEEFDWHRLFVQLHVSASDYLDAQARRINSLEIHLEPAGLRFDEHGQRLKNVNFMMGSENNSFYGGKNLNNALVLAIAGRLAEKYLQSPLAPR